ncbi:MAG: DnaA/Hda family protein [Coriobacteriaceae bacterium]|nr:DnaA/Hda family protein [Coriobacteriaceae bacterium]
MDNEARILLDDVIEFCRRDEREVRLINMLAQCEATSFIDDAITIQVPSRFAYTYLERNRGLVEAYLEQIAFTPIQLNVEIAGEVTGSGGVLPAAPTGAGEVLPGGTSPQPAAPQAGRTQEDPTTHTRGAGLPQAYAPAPEPLEPKQPVQKPAEAGRGGISVVNTVSPDQFRKMMAEMRGAEKPQTAAGPSGSSATRAAAPAAPNHAEPEPADINSKFTFESFVAGDENRHAFNSAMRFAAYAEEPGQCPSLFLYGNSGLGKTHLLFAVRNYLAKEKPYIRVKYVNSQAYVDDYMQELSQQHGKAGVIMKDYRDADILIIDDVQNIVGKQASVEFFFQLVDSFIRSGKKIAIASDRAPKKLGMDERLTSRFNAGMLCLVSEPGFEMKYLILKRYYENIIRGGNDVSAMNVDTSLLSALQSSEGYLSDENLRHMAEISGNNIRELESFCERCAGLSSEREASGSTLSTDDIDRIANEYFDTAQKVIHVTTVQSVVEEHFGVSHEELIGPRRTANIAFARHVAVYLANNMCEMTTPAIGAEFGGRDHSTVLNSIKVVENKMKEDRRICEDLQAIKNKIVLKS